MKRIAKALIFWFLTPLCFKRIPSNQVYLTFDDGPHPANTPAILTELKQHGIKATFFMLGEAMDSYPDIVQQIIAEGHCLGYHSYNHLSLKKTSWRQLNEDIQQLRRLERQFNIRIGYYRPPYGDLSLTGLLRWRMAGLKTALWNVDSRDSFDQQEQVLANLSAENLSQGDIILLHDDYEHARSLLAQALPGLLKANFRFARLKDQ